MKDIEILLGEIIEMANAIRMHIGDSGMHATEVAQEHGADLQCAHANILHVYTHEKVRSR